MYILAKFNTFKVLKTDSTIQYFFNTAWEPWRTRRSKSKIMCITQSQLVRDQHARALRDVH